MNYRNFTLLASVGLLATWQAVADPAAPSGLPNTVEQRITDGAIRADLNYLQGLQARIHKLNEGGNAPVRSYGLAKAQCWLDFATSEYRENDRTGVIEDAAGEAAKAISALEQQQPVDTATRVVASSKRIRDDLWARAQALQSKPNFAAPNYCANALTACLEIKLVEAGHDLNETGWRHAREAIGEAEQMAAEADAVSAACGVSAPPSAAASSDADADADHDGVVNAKDDCPNTALKQRVDAHGCDLKDAVPLGLRGVNFARDSADITPASRSALDEAASTLKRYPELAIEVQGHTDSHASDDYNQKLSQRRADAVMAALRSGGVVNTLSAKGYGESQPIADNDSAQGRAKNRRVVLKIVP